MEEYAASVSSSAAKQMNSKPADGWDEDIFLTTSFHGHRNSVQAPSGPGPSAGSDTVTIGYKTDLEMNKASGTIKTPGRQGSNTGRGIGHPASPSSIHSSSSSRRRMGGAVAV